MCGRFSLANGLDTLAERFGFELPQEGLQPRYNIAPGQPVYVIVCGWVRRMVRMEWGLIPPWVKEGGKTYRVINVRAETIANNRVLGLLAARRRCIVPADGFYEWKKEGGRKIPMRVTLKTGEPFAFAGLWNTWKKHDGDVLLTFAIVTTTANELIEPIHSRMPVILDREGEEIWASGETLDVSRVCPLLKPYPSDELKIWRVSPLVNSSRIDSPECLKPC